MEEKDLKVEVEGNVLTVSGDGFSSFRTSFLFLPVRKKNSRANCFVIMNWCWPQVAPAV